MYYLHLGSAGGAKMGQVITVMNMKGGVGKTTVSAHIGGIIARYADLSKKPQRVLLVDYDPQFNLSQIYLPAKTYFQLEKSRKTTIAILLDDDTDLDPYHLQVPGNHVPPKPDDLSSSIYKFKSGGGLDLIPSTLDLMYVALGQADAQIRPLEERFRKFIDSCKAQYDLVLIDCHPAGSIFTKTSLRNSNHVLIPVVPQRFAVRGIGLMMNFINAQAPGNAAPTAHILFNSTPRTGPSKEELQIRGDPLYSSLCLTNTLKRFKAFTEPEAGSGFVWHSTKPYSTEAFRNLYSVAKELTARIGV
jgi:chromosome partitioning protein